MTAEEIKALQDEKAALEKQLADAGDVSGLRKQFEEAEKERKELIEARDKAKAKAREEEAARLAEQGEFKTLAEQREMELSELQAKLAGLDGKVKTYQEREEQEFKDLLPLVPETLRETVSDEALDLSKRLELARKLVGTKPNAPGVRIPGGQTDSKVVTQEAFNQKSPHEKMEFMKSGGKIKE